MRKLHKFLLTIHNLCNIIVVREEGTGLKRRDLVKELEDGGFRLLRDDGDHTVYTKPGYRRIEVPKHREINEYTARAILKQAGLR